MEATHRTLPAEVTSLVIKHVYIYHYFNIIIQKRSPTRHRCSPDMFFVILHTPLVLLTVTGCHFFWHNDVCEEARVKHLYCNNGDSCCLNSTLLSRWHPKAVITRGWFCLLHSQGKSTVVYRHPKIIHRRSRLFTRIFRLISVHHANNKYQYNHLHDNENLNATASTTALLFTNG
jgi:hypothetical protein